MNSIQILNTSAQSPLTESLLEESNLNNNVNFSKLELSQITTNNTIQDIEMLSNVSTATIPNLSITLDQKETEVLQRHDGKFLENSFVMDITQKTNGTLGTNVESLGKSTTTTTVKEVSIALDVEDECVEVEDESVIPVEDDDDDVAEVSTLENTEETQQHSLCNMFSHLQPNKTTAETENLQKIKQDQNMPEPSKEQDSPVEPTSQEEHVSQVEPKSQEEHVSQIEQEPLEEQESQMEQEPLEEQESLMHQEHQEEQESILEPTSFMEQESDIESSQFLDDETDLFQYPFIEVGRRLWPSSANKQHYTKGCLWSPDGTCLLVPVHLDGMHIVELPTDIYAMQELNPERNISDLSSVLHVKEGGTVYDCCWYPYMNSSDPATCSWLATRQHEPIQMWDAFTGELRCSYRGYDDVDEVESAISIVFSNDGTKVIGGYKKTIKVFDTNIPGRDCFTIPVKRAVSCFALTTDNDNCVTAGTWMGYINHYDMRAPKLGPLFTLGGHTGGITLLKYSPTHQNWYLFSGARRDNKILQWDMRNYTEPVQIFERNVETNQKIYYDLTPLHKWLGTGDTKGLIKIWNLEDKEQTFQLPLHDDCCNGISFHPSLPIISTSSGQYHFVDVIEDEVKINRDQPTEKVIDYENSLLLLWYGPSMPV